MAVSISTGWIEQLGLADRQAPEFFRSFDELQAMQSGVAQAHVMRRAWKDLELDGILYQDKSPYVYFKEVSSIDPVEMRRLHRKLWNQGIAPLLVVVSPSDFHVYSSLTLPAKEDEEVSDGDRLVEILSRTADVLELRQFTRSLQFGEFFRQKPQSFNPKLRVDRYLLENLEAARERLREPVEGVTLELKVIHALLWRTIFICYLTDRRIIDSRYFKKVGAGGVGSLLQLLEEFSPETSKELLYGRLFQQLKQDFNGDLFEGDLLEESKLIKNDHIRTLNSLLRGDDLSSGQLSLGFWAYDFNVIPIETISGIYERFLEGEDAKQKRQSGTYYTPRFLAEIVLDTALEKFASLLDKKFLDPACGSGIFLVSLFNRIAEEWLRNNREASNEERARALSTILQNQLFGVDADPTETACRIAAFSLYLAFLDQLEPRAIQELQEQGNVLPNLIGRNIICQDFFDDALALPDDFDLVIGNPPWARATGDKTLVERWCRRKGYSNFISFWWKWYLAIRNGQAINERQLSWWFTNFAYNLIVMKAGLPIAQRQLAYGFIWKAPLHLKSSGRICFLLPSAILLNHQDKAIKAQREWLSTYTIEQVINLSDMRFYLFDGAIRPALIVSYTKDLPDKQNAFIPYLVPKTELETLKAEIISIVSEDRAQVRLAELLYELGKDEAALAWKKSFWGTPRDQKFLDRLSNLPRLSDAVDQLKVKPHKRTKRWIIGQGFQPEGANDDPEKSKIPSWSSDHLFVEGKSKAIDLLLLESDCGKVGDRFQRLRRLPDEKIFQKPHVLITKGLRVAFADFDVAFRHAIQGIHGSEEDTDLLKFLAVVLNSNLASYFLFHTSANWGTERDETHEEELLRMPFPFLEDTFSPVESREILREVSVALTQVRRTISHNFLERSNVIEKAKHDLLAHVYRYYQIDELEQILINDTVNCWIPSSTPSRGSTDIPTLKQSTPSDRIDYLTLLCKLLNTWSKRGRYQVLGKILVSTRSGMGIVVLQKVASQGSASSVEEESSSQLDEALTRITQLLPRYEGSIAYYRNLKVFDRDKLYILKPLTFRFWSKTFALNDADEIAAEILTTNYRND
ncbi:MAG TPA: N-6 DNA methylase [Elainellaceae cyanobacterium]